MNIILYRYGSICEPDIIDSFQKMGLTVVEETLEITQKKISNSLRVELLSREITKYKPLFVFSINFYPAIAEICQIHHTLYFCWTVDSPVPELFSESIKRSTNRIFLFDRAQYNRFAKYNPNCIFHLPLASATQRFDKVIQTITPAEEKKWKHDISFIGSLYKEKSPLSNLSGLSDHSRGYLDALEESALKIYGCNFTEESLDPNVVQEIKSLSKSFYDPGKAVAPSAEYVCAHSYVGYEIAVKERILTLQTLAKHFAVDLYTNSDISELSDSKGLCDTIQMTNKSIPSTNIGLHPHGGVASLTEMPKIFHLSKINLNMTIKPIMEGLPLRIFDILGCGGFCMTNYQPELTDHFEIGVDLEAYTSLEELVDKCKYYLFHEDERKQIALNGYRKVCEGHTYLHRMSDMIKLAAVQ